MDAPFPFGFPLPTAFYLTLYVFTLLIHVIFMNYVFAGSAYVLVESIARGRLDAQQPGTAVLMLRDWLPFALSAAITAGVAPLLFVQILYKTNFYTANLLLFHRWMILLPVLLIGFYLLYLLKASRVVRSRNALGSLVSACAFACIAFTGYSWAENHQLSLDAQVWPTFYLSPSAGYQNPAILPRMVVWFGGSFPTMCLFVLWQLRAAQRRGVVVSPSAFRRLVGLAIVGLALASIGAAWWYSVADEHAKSVLTSNLAFPYLVLVMFGVILHLMTWIRAWKSTALTTAWLVCGWISLLATMLGMAVVRECVRLASMDMAPYFEQHADAFRVGGFWIFVAFLLINGLLIGWCVRLAVRSPDPSQ